MRRSVSEGISDYRKSIEDFSHTCKSCCELLYQLPFADTSLNSSSPTLCSNVDEDDDNSVWDEFDSIARNYCKNFNIGHVNANSIGGFKFYEIKSWLLSWRFNIIVISKTKIDKSFPDSQFQIDGYRLCRSDRKAGGGGLMIYVRSDVHFVRVKQLRGLSTEHWSGFRTESIVLKV